MLLNNDANPIGTRVHFDRIELEGGVDYIIIADADGNPYQWVTGSHPDGLVANAVLGAAVQIQLETDGSGRAWGYNVRQVSTGEVAEAETAPVASSILVDSDHPYQNSYDNIWTITNPDPDAKSSKIHFSRISTEKGSDYVHPIGISFLSRF